MKVRLPRFTWLLFDPAGNIIMAFKVKPEQFNPSHYLVRLERKEEKE